MNEQLWQQATSLAAQPYKIEVYRDEEATGEAAYLAKYAELDGCMAQGATIEDALANLREAAIDYIYSLLEDDMLVPPPAVMTIARTGASVNVATASTVDWRPSKEARTTDEDNLKKENQSIQADLLYSFNFNRD